MTKTCTEVQDARVMDLIRVGERPKSVAEKLELTEWEVRNAMRRDRERRGVVQRRRRRPAGRRRAKKSKK